MRRWLLVVGGAALTVVLATVAAIGLGTGSGAPAEEPEPGGGTATVTRGSLVDAITVDGHVGYGRVTPLMTAATGTVTWLAPVGSVIDRGDVLLRVDDQPVVLIIGTLPEYRTLTIGTTGNDVRQLEENLVALGYGNGLVVDDTYTGVTADAVRAWQEDLGLKRTGTIELGAVHVEPAPVRVAAHLVRPGAAAGGDVLATTGTVRVVEADVDAEDAAWAVLGASVDVVLPDGRGLPGSVVEASGPQEGSASAQIMIAVEDQDALAAVERSIVTVRRVVAERHDVLSVPVSALVALAEGGYGLEVVEGTGTRYIPVTVGMFAEGRVEVSGPEVVEGLAVRTP